MNKYLKICEKKKWIILAIIISIISHSYIILDKNLLNSGDWVYYSNSLISTFKDYALYLPSFNLGTTMTSPNNFIFYWGAYIFNLLTGANWDLFTRIFFLLPIIILTPLFSFLLFKKITKNEIIAFCATSIYCFNTFFLKLQLDWITYGFIWWILPAILLLIINYLEKEKKKYLFYIGALIFISMGYEIRITLLILIAAFFFILIKNLNSNKKITSKIKSIIATNLAFFGGIGLHLFWIIPFMIISSNKILSSVATNPFISFFNILDILTLHSYQWSGNLIYEPFIRQSIDPWLFALPIIAIVGIIAIKKYYKENKSEIIFFSLTLIILVFIAKQNFAPFTTIYTWLFNNIPLFNLYRESSKFIILIALSLSFFFGIGAYEIYKSVKKYNKIIAIILIFIILTITCFINLINVFNQNIGGMTKGVTISEDYSILEKKIEKDNFYYRTLWLPAKPRFGFFSSEHPYLSTVDMTKIYKDKTNFTLFDKSKPVPEQILFLLNQNYSDRLLDNTAVKYIIIPNNEIKIKKINKNTTLETFYLFEHYGDRNYYINDLKTKTYLKKIDFGTKDLIIYENENYKPHIYITKEKESIEKNISFENIEYYKKNQIKYSIFLKNISEVEYLSFSEAYNSEWKLNIGQTNWISILLKNDLVFPDEIHEKSDSNLNSFKIDPEYIKLNFPKEKYALNPDNSINIELTLYFKPQIYFYLGLVLSAIILIGSSIFLLRYNKNTKI